MMSLRGVVMSVAMHGVAAALVSASAVQAVRPAEDVPAIAVDLVLDMETVPVTPSSTVEEQPEPVQEVIEAPVVEPPREAPPPPPLETASVTPLPTVSPPAPQLTTPLPAPEAVPVPVVKTAPLAQDAKVTSSRSSSKPKPQRKKEAQRRVEARRVKQVAALAAGKGSVGALRSTDGRAAEQTYNSRVLAKLRAAKKYPSVARGNGIEGTAILAFTISASGSLTSARVVKGAGHALLDDAVMAMARNAAPFPAFPTSISKKQLTFRVPVQFKIN